MTRIEFRNFPVEIRDVYRSLVERHRGIIPDWCSLLTLNFTEGGNNGEYSATCHASHEYRRASHFVYAGWLNSPAHIRELDVVHELFHIVVAPAHEYSRKQLEAMLADATPAHRKTVLNSHVEHCEMVVEDLTNLYMEGRLVAPSGSSIDDAAR